MNRPSGRLGLAIAEAHSAGTWVWSAAAAVVLGLVVRWAEDPVVGRSLAADLAVPLICLPAAAGAALAGARRRQGAEILFTMRAGGALGQTVREAVGMGIGWGLAAATAWIVLVLCAGPAAMPPGGPRPAWVLPAAFALAEGEEHSLRAALPDSSGPWLGSLFARSVLSAQGSGYEPGRIGVRVRREGRDGAWIDLAAVSEAATFPVPSGSGPVQLTVRRTGAGPVSLVPPGGIVIEGPAGRTATTVLVTAVGVGLVAWWLACAGGAIASVCSGPLASLVAVMLLALSAVGAAGPWVPSGHELGGLAAWARGWQAPLDMSLLVWWGLGMAGWIACRAAWLRGRWGSA